jgi:DNA-binding LacI/PurR family transcriptional regulator
MAATVREVARQAGVSVATVSRVLNNPEVVAGGTKDRVLGAISSLKYSPNLAAASLGRNHRSARRRTDFSGSNSDRAHERSEASETTTDRQLELLKRENDELRQIIRNFRSDPRQRKQH